MRKQTLCLCENRHRSASASKEAYKSSFFPQTIRDWNDLPDSLIASVETSDDGVQVRNSCESQGLISLLAQPPGDAL